MASAASSTSNGAEVMAPPRKMSVRLHLLKGTFLVDDAAGGAAMDPALWSRMPEDLLWRVVVLLPPAKHFQLQLVSRQWRQVLTSADFRKQVVATTPARSRLGAADQQRVICGVCVGSDNIYGSSSSCGSSSNSKMVKDVDIDLSFVPSGFWRSDSFTVLAAADGLVCIFNGDYRDEEDLEPKGDRFCVINPLTRTFKVLPQVPFSPLDTPRGWQERSAPLAITVFERDDDDWMVATCYLEGAGLGQWTQWTMYYSRYVQRTQSDMVRGFVQYGLGDSHFVVCAGEAYMFADVAREMQVRFAPAEGASPATVTFDYPVWLDLDWLATPSSAFSQDCVKLVTHRGKLFFMSGLVQVLPGPAMVCGMWRLVRRWLTWEAVAGLEIEQVHRLTGFKYQDAPWEGPSLCSVDAAGDLLCCTLGFKCGQDVGDYLQIIVGLSLETWTWELLHDQLRHVYQSLLELRPDFFLA